MAPTIKHKCTACGDMHMGHKDVCWKCERKHIQDANQRICALCGSKINRGGRGVVSSPYCCNQCSSAVGNARAKAIQIVAKSIRSGDMKKAKECTCVDCGKPAIDYDHREYLKPLDVVPVCRGCNIKRGPAIDIKQSVACHLGISVDEIPAEIEKRKEKWQRMYDQLNKSVFRKAA